MVADMQAESFLGKSTVSLGRFTSHFAAKVNLKTRSKIMLALRSQLGGFFMLGLGFLQTLIVLAVSGICLIFAVVVIAAALRIPLSPDQSEYDEARFPVDRP